MQLLPRGLCTSYRIYAAPNKDHLLGPLEEKIHQHFIPALTGQAPPNDTTCHLLALPPRLGGLGIINPTQLSQMEHPASVAVAAPLRDLILEQSLEYTFGTLEAQMNAKTEVRRLRQEKLSSVAAQVRSDLPNSLQRSMDLAQEKGASSWLSALPREEFGYTLHKGAFRDALALRYGWLSSNTPTSCACGASFTVEHALSCPKGGFPIIRHNEVRDLTANLMSEVCHDVRIEPDLQPITGEAFSRTSTVVEDGARLDISASGFWGGRFERAFFDVRVFNPHARSNRQHSLPAMYRKHESIKRRTYEERVREVEHGSFTPLVMSLTGGLSRAANVCFKRLASMLASKFDQPYSCTINWLRCRLCFSLLRASIQCIRGARSARGHASRVPAPPLELVVAEVNV